MSFSVFIHHIIKLKDHEKGLREKARLKLERLESYINTARGMKKDMTREGPVATLTRYRAVWHRQETRDGRRCSLVG